MAKRRPTVADVKTVTVPQFQQRKHWETLGQLARIRGLLDYMIGSGNGLPDTTVQQLKQIRLHTTLTYGIEAKNNEFINLKKRPSWKPRVIKGR